MHSFDWADGKIGLLYVELGTGQLKFGGQATDNLGPLNLETRRLDENMR